ncbi:hypothetical protein ACHAQH_009328 [Verticillium albo-atrum]
MHISCLVLLVGTIEHVHATASRPLADTVFRNGSIYTIDKGMTKVEGMVVKDGLIEYVGSESGLEAFIDEHTKIINLGGRVMIPGLVDAHMHLQSGGLGLLQCNLNYQPLTWEQTAAHITGCATDDGGTDGAWLEVINMDYASLVTKSGNIDKTKLDVISKTRPILIRSSDRHTGLVNSKALEMSNITAETAEPDGGVIERMSGGKEPSGALQDSAIALIKVPAADFNTITEAIRAALKQLREAGITTFQDAASSPRTGSAFQVIEKEGSLSSRGFFDYRVSAPSSVAAVPQLIKDVLNVTSFFSNRKDLAPKPSVKWQAIKGFIDGVITYPASTAAVVEPYRTPVNGNPDSCSWAPDNSTLVKPYWPQDVLDATIEQLVLNNIDAQFHGDGDLGVRVVLDAVEAFRKRHPGVTDYRIGIAHNELSHPDDWPRFSELNVDAIVSFQWAQMSAMFIPYTFRSFGPGRKNYLEAWGNILEYGDSLVYGSDWPIDPLDEFLALKVAVTRTGDPMNPHSTAYNGSQYDGVALPGLLISREEALRAITIRAAGFLRAGDKIGSLEKGKFADAIILERDYFEVPEQELGRNRVLLTMVGGEIVYVADGEDFGVKPTFDNNDDIAKKLTSRTIGGVDGRDLDHDGIQALKKLRTRQQCGHGIHKH